MHTQYWHFMELSACLAYHLSAEIDLYAIVRVWVRCVWRARMWARREQKNRAEVRQRGETVLGLRVACVIVCARGRWCAFVPFACDKDRLSPSHEMGMEMAVCAFPNGFAEPSWSMELNGKVEICTFSVSAIWIVVSNYSNEARSLSHWMVGMSERTGDDSALTETV